MDVKRTITSFDNSSKISALTGAINVCGPDHSDCGFVAKCHSCKSVHVSIIRLLFVRQNQKKSFLKIYAHLAYIYLFAPLQIIHQHDRYFLYVVKLLPVIHRKPVTNSTYLLYNAKSAHKIRGIHSSMFWSSTEVINQPLVRALKAKIVTISTGAHCEGWCGKPTRSCLSDRVHSRFWPTKPRFETDDTKLYDVILLPTAS